jgi:hypothetical protein
MEGRVSTNIRDLIRSNFRNIIAWIEDFISHYSSISGRRKLFKSPLRKRIISELQHWSDP